MNQKTKPASALIFTLIILFIGVVSAIGIASATLISRKMSTTSGKSVASFQVADSGAEIVLQKMKDTLDSDSNAKITDMGMTCSNGTVTGSISSGKEYEVAFLDENGNQLAGGCSAQISDVQKIRSIGTYAQISRAIEAAVAASGCGFKNWEAKQFDTVYEAETDGFVIVYINTTQGNVYNVFADSSSNPSTIRATASSSAGHGNPTANLTIPVLKGWHWRVSPASTSVYWVPFEC